MLLEIGEAFLMTTRSLRFYFIFCFAFCSFNYLLFCNKVMRIVELVLEFSCCNVAARVSYCSLLRSGGAGVLAQMSYWSLIMFLPLSLFCNVYEMTGHFHFVFLH